ncbi:hypothetical protein CK203_058149 [Vitis vinifera]|uniref:Uncharacterized protein n=1 Tax=Vitis vinifera TaxID=29760 RepID=A0A438GQF1_VITVI|nr:hypothetical protein CK203_058149 [Vitis vinifera]
MGSRPNRSHLRIAYSMTLWYPPIPPLTPILASEDAHACMDRLEQRMRHMRISDRSISWDDFDGAPVANLPAQFKMVEIERYTGIGCPKIHFRLYSIVMRAHGLDEAQLIMLFPMSLSGVAQCCSCFNTVIDVSRRKLEALRQEPEESTLYGIDEGITRGFWLESFPSDSKGKKPSRGQRPEDVEADTTVFPTRYAFEPSFLKAHGEWFVDSGPRHDTNHCTALRHAIQDLIDQGLVNLGQPSVTTNPLPTHSTHAVPAPPGDIHHIDFVEDDSIHMLSWDDGFLEPIVLDDGL